VKRFFNSCGRQRENISLLAAGVLPEQEKTQVQNHLRECPACRQYYEEIKSVAVPLGNWAESRPEIQPDTAAQRRWAKAIEMAGRPEAVPGFVPAIRGRMREIFWPWRHVWAGLATVWILLIAINLAERDPAPTGKVSTALATVSFREEQKVLNELFADRVLVEAAEPPKVFSPRPRTEKFQSETV